MKLSSSHSFSHSLIKYSMIRNSIIALTAMVASLSHEAAQAEEAVIIPVIQAKDFCQRFSNTMSTLSTQQGLDRRESARLGERASSKIIAQMKSGVMDAFLDASNLEAGPAATGDHLWFNIPDILLSSMGIAPQRLIFIENINELKFTPNIMPGMQILVLVKDMGDLTPARAKLVTKSAQALGVQLNFIWVGGSRGKAVAGQVRDLALMASSTGGAFLDFGTLSACSRG
jgi:hypothetical protein